MMDCYKWPILHTIILLYENTEDLPQFHAIPAVMVSIFTFITVNNPFFNSYDY